MKKTECPKTRFGKRKHLSKSVVPLGLFFLTCHIGRLKEDSLGSESFHRTAQGWWVCSEVGDLRYRKALQSASAGTTVASQGTFVLWLWLDGGIMNVVVYFCLAPPVSLEENQLP